MPQGLSLGHGLTTRPVRRLGHYDRPLLHDSELRRAPGGFDLRAKDVRGRDEHESCRYGEGCVPVADCVRTLRRLAYAGGVSVEHHPARFDPRADCRAMREQLLGWLQ